jgi:putative hydrolase of the HAD superfamily
MMKVVFVDLDETLVAQERAFECAYQAVARLAADVAGVDVGSFAEAVPKVADACFGGLRAAEFVRRCRFGGRDVLWGDTGVGDAEGQAGAAASESLRQLGKEATAYRVAVWSSLLEEFGVRNTDLCGSLDARFRREMEAGIETFPDVPSALERLSRSYRLGVITNGLPLSQRRKLERLGMARHFETLVASAEVGVGKPAGEIFRSALNRMRVAAGDALMVGDSLEGDVLGAQRAGMRAIWLRRGGQIGEGFADAVPVAADLQKLEAVLNSVSLSSAL